MIQAVIFDHDGTLVDSEHTHFALWRDLLAEYGVTFEEGDYQRHMAGVPTRQNADYLIARHPGLPVDADTLCQLRHSRAQASVGRQASPLMPGVRDTLEWLHQRQVRMAIATGALPLEIGPTLSEHGLAAYFPVVATSADVAHSKPAPDVYQLALARLGLAAEDCVAIEDSPTGLRAALDAGLRCLVVRNAYSAGHSFTGATAVVNTMAEAKDWCEAFISKR